jgi:hypothetical protein
MLVTCIKFNNAMTSASSRYRPQGIGAGCPRETHKFSSSTSCNDSFNRQYKTSLTDSLDLWYQKDPLSPPNCCPSGKLKHASLGTYPTPLVILQPHQLQCWCSPDVSINLEKITLLVWKTDLALFVKARFLEVLRKPVIVSTCTTALGWMYVLTSNCPLEAQASPALFGCRPANSSARVRSTIS